MNKQYYVYIMASKHNGILYVGVTSNLAVRVTEHRQDMVKGFTNTHHVHNLVYYEVSQSIDAAIVREKQLKKWNRAWKVRLIEKSNPDWRDLYCDILQ